MLPSKSCRVVPNCSKESRPSCTALAMAGPAFEPNISDAMLIASVEVSAPRMDSSSAVIASFSGTPSSAAFANAFFIPAMTVEASMPDLLRFAMKNAESDAL